jgi:hypothetical protein
MPISFPRLVYERLMQGDFRGLVLGLSKREVSAAMGAGGLPGQVRGFSPLMTLAFGISRQALLEHKETPPRPYRYDLPMLLGLWAVTAAVFLAAVASIIRKAPAGQQLLLVAAAIVLGAASLLVSFWTAKKPKHPALWADSYFGDLAMSPMLGGGELGIPFILIALLVIFVLFILWLPALLLALSPLSLGGLWRTYRACLLTAEVGPRLSMVAKGLLDRGAVLSRAWERHLDPADAKRAADLRRQHVRVHQLFNGLGLSTLAFGVLAAMSFAVEWQGWLLVLALSGGAVAVVFVIFGANLWALRCLRRGSGADAR